MAEHVSNLKLDELASGFSDQAMTAHLVECAECQRRLRVVQEARREVMASPAFERTFRKVVQPAPKLSSGG